jgi:hypothetical protein
VSEPSPGRIEAIAGAVLRAVPGWQLAGPPQPFGWAPDHHLRCRLVRGDGSLDVIIRHSWSAESHEVEVSLYQQILPRLPVRTAKLLASFVVDPGEPGWMVLEDLGPAPASAADPEHRNAFLTALGRLHGCSARLLQEGGMGDLSLPIFSDDSAPTSEWCALLRRAPDAAGIEPWMAGSVVGLVRRLCGQPVVLVHGDTDLSNLIITDAGPALVDWEKAQIGPASLDLGGLVEHIASPAEWERYRQTYGEGAAAEPGADLLAEWIDLGDAYDSLRWICYYLNAAEQGRGPDDDWRASYYDPRLHRLESLRQRRAEWFVR